MNWIVGGVLAFLTLGSIAGTGYALWFRIPRFSFSSVDLAPSTKRFARDYQTEVKDVKQFGEDFINSYREYIKTHCDPEFWADFGLVASNASVKAVFSQVAESALIFSPSVERKLRIECTKYQTQFSVYSGADGTNPLATLTKPVDEVAKMFLADEPMIHVIDSHVMLGDLTLRPRMLKVFSISPGSTIILRSVNIEFIDRQGNVGVFVYDDHVIWAGSTNFSLAKERGLPSGILAAQSDVLSQMYKSPAFKRAMAYRELRPYAEEIERAISRRDNEGIEYPPWKMDKDVAALAAALRTFGYDDKEVNKLRQYVAGLIVSGSLLWHYDSLIGFMLQWSVLNMGLLLLACVVVFLLRKKPTMVGRIPWDQLGPAAIVLGINSWPFLSKPQFLVFKYWCLPGVLMVVAICIALFFLPVPEKKE